MKPSLMAERRMKAERNIAASIEAFGQSLGVSVVEQPRHRDPSVRELLVIEWIDARLKEIGSAIGIDMQAECEPLAEPLESTELNAAEPEPEPEPEPTHEPEPLVQDAEPLESTELGMDGELPVQAEAAEQQAEPEHKPSRKRK